MRILISADYLLASAFCAQDKIQHYYAGLRKLRDEHEAGRPVFLEPDAILKLQSKGMYPSFDLFKRNFPAKHDFGFGADHITKTVIYLVNNVAQLKVDEEILAEWQDVSLEVDPVLHSDADREEQLANLMVDLSLENAGFGYDHIVFHHHLPDFPRDAVVTGTITSVVPGQFVVPKEISHKISISDNLVDYILRVKAESLYQESANDSELKRSLYFGVVQFLAANGHDPKSFDDQCFTLGENFRGSLLGHECSGTHAFSSLVFQTVIRALAGYPKNSIDTFDTSENSNVQLVRDGRKAWRTHVSSGGRGLRLMLWTHSNGLIELANIGNKWEERIY